MTVARVRVARWLVPVAVLAVLVAMAGLRATLASATPSLPDLTAAQVLAKVANTKVQSLSGDVRTSTDLGLPALPDRGGALAPQARLSGTHTLRVYLDGPDRQRVDLLGSLAETKAVHNGRDLWQWSSSTNGSAAAIGISDAWVRSGGTLIHLDVVANGPALSTLRIAGVNGFLATVGHTAVTRAAAR